MKKKFKELKPQRHLKKKEIIQRITNLFCTYPKELFTHKQISSKLGAVTPVEKKIVSDILNTLFFEDFLIKVEKGKYCLNNLGNTAEGLFERRSNGKNSFVPENGEKPVFVAERNSMHAMNGDKVRVQILAKRKGRESEAEVIEILHRAQNIFVGILEVTPYYAYLTVDSKILANDIMIPSDKLMGGKSGQKAIARIIEWPEKVQNPIGEIIDVLGDSGNRHTEMHAILAEYGLPYKYPQNIEKAAQKIPALITQKEIDAREDFRDTLTFTIDPKDAKDFDDALSIKKLPNQLWEIGVHIADVTYYVKQGSVIDKEAAQRATSIYLVDRTIPMLPEILSNDLCSLRPKEDKLCFSIIFEMTDNAELKNYRIKRTVIHSNQRFTYEEAQEILEKFSGFQSPESDMEKALHTLDRLAKILRKQRFAVGAINFDRVEMKFDIDKDGKPLSIYFKEEKDANKLIEEFMLLANKSVAEFIGKVPRDKRAKTFVYRIHDVPNSEKMENLVNFIHRFGYKIKSKGENHEISKSINSLLDEIQGKKEQNLIETVALRAMAKAIYSTTNIGHYGLAFKYYTHFTSPIRRYPDMMVHRLLDKYLNGGRSVSEQKTEEACKHCSNMENIATQAERTSIKYKQVEFMSNKIGMVFNGVISNVTEWGLYIELTENMCEGMVSVRDLNDDFYEFDEKNYRLIGKRKKQQYCLGDPLKVKVIRANLEKRQLDFVLVE
jgi:ribonuclease R